MDFMKRNYIKFQILINFLIFVKFFRYSEVQFSKNADKYIKYRPQNVTDMLNSLFDDTF